METVQIKQNSVVDDLRKLYDDLHFALNRIEYHIGRTMSKRELNAGITLYCTSLHNVRKNALLLFESDRFKSEGVSRDYKFYFFDPLKKAKDIIGKNYKNRELSMFEIQIAMNYLENLIMILSRTAQNSSQASYRQTF